MNEKEYDDLFNEGGEGFNPYKKQADGGEPMWSKIDNRIAKLTRLLNGMNSDDLRRKKYEAEKAELEKVYEEIKPW
jgi:hypothetical protein